MPKMEPRPGITIRSIVEDLRAENKRLREVLEARHVYAPLLSTEKLAQLLQGAGYDGFPIQRKMAEWELMARRALLPEEGNSDLEAEQAGPASPGSS